MIEEAIVLAGGLGTRLSQVVSDVPKPMAPIGGRPFLAYLLDQLVRYGVRRIVLSVGYKRETVTGYFGKVHKGAELIYAVEELPCGTGGGVMKALPFIADRRCFILNGDSYFDADLNALGRFHASHGVFTLSLKNMTNVDRYGVVKLAHDGRVIGFEEKRPRSRGLVNCGVYVADTRFLRSLEFPERFSFETGFLEKYYSGHAFFGLPLEGYFVDIGIPESYREAQAALPALQ